MDKTLYTLIVHSENIAGLLNQITAVFTRRQINIESLNTSPSEAEGIHRFTIVITGYIITNVTNEMMQASRMFMPPPIIFNERLMIKNKKFQYLMQSYYSNHSRIIPSKNRYTLIK